MDHFVEFSSEHVYGSFSHEYPPRLTVRSGDRITLETLDVRWGRVDAQGQRVEVPRREGTGHAVCGPFLVEGAEPGMTIEVRIDELRPASRGFNLAGGFQSWQNQQLGLVDASRVHLEWALDRERGVAKTAVGSQSVAVGLRPFLGVIGLAPEGPGPHSTTPPRSCGGNLDCKELVVGSSLFLPVMVSGAYLFTGDGHARQGDGEVSGLAIECPMDTVSLTLRLHPHMHLTMPRARTPAGWITFGLSEDLNAAAAQALDEMLNWMVEIYGFTRAEALAVASTVVDLRVTQVVNQVKGVHAVLSPEAIACLL
ncbi:MAG: acetamidase/formamidase family protein [Firmicutes bacterium]|nr:acetamidase/formamidase family protein [Bacillota bacterium]